MKNPDKNKLFCVGLNWLSAEQFKKACKALSKAGLSSAEACKAFGEAQNHLKGSLKRIEEKEK